jgi:hypothetical protein
MLFLIFFVPIGLLAAYLAVTCVRQKYTGAALLMGGIAAICLILSLVILYAGLFFVSST